MNRSKISLFLLTVMVFLCTATSLHAQSGCTDSPEAPTDVLLLVGAVGLTKGSAIVKWLRQRR
jgi:XrtJ-associated TM-motif-TM protein